MDCINTNVLPSKKILTFQAARTIGKAALAPEKSGYNHLIIIIASRLHFNLQNRLLAKSAPTCLLGRRPDLVSVHHHRCWHSGKF